jgi:hypothetical protein
MKWILLLLAVVIAGCTTRSTTGVVTPIYPLPSTLKRYVPAVYDDFGVPIRSADDPAAGPILWIWPNGVVNFTGAQFETFYPRKQQFPNGIIKGWYDWRMNFTASAYEGLHEGFLVIGTEAYQNDSSVTIAPGYTVADMPPAQKLGMLVIVTGMSDSLLEVKAEMYVKLGVETDTVQTFARLVDEHFGR